MRDFKRGGRDFKRRDFDRPQVAQAMHQAICSNCGKTCEVPFKPNGSKPVFCRECFQANRTGEKDDLILKAETIISRHLHQGLTIEDHIQPPPRAT
jgi:CxxC-x17-CxxC domain-containing protein